jgi:hypothetical protein
MGLVFSIQKNSGDQETGEYKKYVNTHPAGPRKPKPGMK